MVQFNDALVHRTNREKGFQLSKTPSKTPKISSYPQSFTVIQLSTIFHVRLPHQKIVYIFRIKKFLHLVSDHTITQQHVESIKYNCFELVYLCLYILGASKYIVVSGAMC